MSFDLKEFLENPSIEKIQACRKDDLSIAEHFDITARKSLLKKEIRQCVLEKLIDLKVLSPPRLMAKTWACVSSPPVGALSQGMRRLAEPTTPPVDHGEEVAPATLPRFDPLSPQASPGSGLSSKLA